MTVYKFFLLKRRKCSAITWVAEGEGELAGLIQSQNQVVSPVLLQALLEHH